MWVPQLHDENFCHVTLSNSELHVFQEPILMRKLSLRQRSDLESTHYGQAGASTTRRITRDSSRFFTQVLKQLL